MKNKYLLCIALFLLMSIYGCSGDDPSVHDVVKESKAAIKAFANNKSEYTPSNKKISIKARVEDKSDQQTGKSQKIMHFYAFNLTPEKREIEFSSNIPVSMLIGANKDLASINKAFEAISECADEYDKNRTESSSAVNPLADKKEEDSGCRTSGLTYNDQPAVDISSEKYPGVYLRLIEVRDNKYTQK